MKHECFARWPMKQRNGDRTVKHKTFFLALFFLYSSLARVLSLSLFVSLHGICKTENSRARLRVPFYPPVRNIKITGSLFQTVSNYLRSICRVTLRNFNDMFATDPLAKPRCVLCIFNVSDIYSDSCEN